MRMQKRCFTFVHCDYHSHCELAHMDPRNGYFDPNAVGEHCHSYKPLAVEIDRHDEIVRALSNYAGAHA